MISHRPGVILENLGTSPFPPLLNLDDLGAIDRYPLSVLKEVT
jgi:hypothetical protein